MSVYTLGGKLVVDATGHPIDCDVCPCTIAPPACCTDGNTLDTVYVWAYASSGVDSLPNYHGCMPLDCPPLDAEGGRKYRTYGLFTGGPFAWNNGAFTLNGMIGCANVQIIGGCEPLSAGPLTGQKFFTTINFDFGGGFIGPQTVANSVIPTEIGMTGAATTQCILTLGCDNYISPSGPTDINYYLTTRDPLTGILCPDTTVMPTTLTFSTTLMTPNPITLVCVPTLYSCTLAFSPLSPEFGSFGCYQWSGYLTDCTSGTVCHGIVMAYLSDISPYTFGAAVAGWVILVYIAASTVVRVYAATPAPSPSTLPGVGVMLDNYPACGTCANTTPMWSNT